MIRALYGALLAWQWVWPLGFGVGGLLRAAAFTLPGLLPLAGILRGRPKARVWGGFVAVAYFVVGVTEAWSHPPSRLPGAGQALLACGYLAALWAVARAGSRGQAGGERGRGEKA